MSRKMCNNLYDVIRGSLLYKNWEDMKLGLQKIRESSQFIICRIKNRFENPTSAGKLSSLYLLTYLQLTLTYYTHSITSDTHSPYGSFRVVFVLFIHSGWRDCNINVFIKGKSGFIFEIQIHHERFTEIRQKEGGHAEYAQFRALLESLEVTNNDKELGRVNNGLSTKFILSSSEDNRYIIFILA